MTATCSKPECDAPAAPSHRWCRGHRNEAMREHRARTGDVPSDELEALKRRTRAHTHTLLRRGRLKRLPCAECGATEVEAHHPDYADPRRVVWLCPDHHRKLHAALGSL